LLQGKKQILHRVNEKELRSIVFLIIYPLFSGPGAGDPFSGGCPEIMGEIMFSKVQGHPVFMRKQGNQQKSML